MIGVHPQQRNKDIPSFLAMVHDSLHTTYVTVRANINLAHQRSIEHYDKERPFPPYLVGDLVWLYASAVKPGRSKKVATMERTIYHY